MWCSHWHDSFRGRIYRHIEVTSFQESDLTVKRVSEFVAWRTAHISCIVFFTSLNLLSVGLISGAHGGQSVCGDIHS